MTNTNLTVTDNSFNDDVLKSATPTLNHITAAQFFQEAGDVSPRLWPPLLLILPR